MATKKRRSIKGGWRHALTMKVVKESKRACVAELAGAIQRATNKRHLNHRPRMLAEKMARRICGT